MEHEAAAGRPAGGRSQGRDRGSGWGQEEACPGADQLHLCPGTYSRFHHEGLAWITILRKREGFRRAFEGFDPERIARYDEADEARLLADPEIIRNRLKVKAAVTNARALLELQRQEGSFDRYCWSFVGGQPRRHPGLTPSTIPAFTSESDALSKDLKRRGFTFVGTTIVYAFMQSVGMVDDHLPECFKYGG